MLKKLRIVIYDKKDYNTYKTLQINPPKYNKFYLKSNLIYDEKSGILLQLSVLIT